ncbi:P-loop containing nucleoside triphosphate hydrolase protein [Cercophora newfieldiana]|uniref:P-loop containing nucleoside triphosphate hydrolase protein n=1 Tax=Cercophora newfieldiana TaxID=92897 RepID=A0AA40CS24_9PEZI|nr:P-loop containing nucleoside triphosphate hydrolase protein [Cercophora newfieldiana]
MAEPIPPKPSLRNRVLSFGRSSTRKSSATGESIHTPDVSQDIQPTVSESLPDLKPDDVVIAVMGVTGVGKSSFISCLSKTAVVGDGVESCTAGVSIHSTFLDGRDVYLIDTPGFNDTNRTDTSVLIEIAAWLKKSYDEKVKLAGVVYMHRISDNRVSGSGTQNLVLFKELCGEAALPCVVLTTSMWDLVPPETAERREQDLINSEEFWGGLVRHGCRVARHDNGSVSAAMIVRHILSQKWPDAFQIQTEMAEGTPLIMTKAGRVLGERLDRQTREAEEEAERLRGEIERLVAEKAEAERKAEEEREARQRQEEERALKEKETAGQSAQETKARQEEENHEMEEALRRAAEAERREDEAKKQAAEAEKIAAEAKIEAAEAKKGEEEERRKRLEEKLESAAKEIKRLEKEKADLRKASRWRCIVM